MEIALVLLALVLVAAVAGLVVRSPPAEVAAPPPPVDAPPPLDAPVRRHRRGDDPHVLRGISEIRGFFRTNQTPIYFVSPTAFNLLGIDRWVRNFHYVNYFDSFDGHAPERVRARASAAVPRVRVDRGDLQLPARRTRRSPTWSSTRGGGGKACFLMFDERDRGAGRRARPEGRVPAAPSCGTGSTPRSSPRSSATRRACRACRTCSAAPTTTPS